MPYLIEHQDVFIGLMSALILALVAFRLRLARRRRNKEKHVGRVDN